MCMKVLKVIRQLLRMVDSFPATQFFRFQGETEYATATGGFLSLIIIVVFVILFTSTGLDVVNKVNVTATSNFQSQIEPSPANITAGPDGDFMFAIKIYGVNFSDPTTTVFDIILSQQSFTPIYNPVSSTVVTMTPCTQYHFNFDESIRKSFYTYNLSQWLCPSMDYQFQLQGKLTSQLFKQFSLTVMRCNTSLHSNCMSDANVAALQNYLGYFTIAVAVVNKQLNPSSSNVYQNFYIDDKNYFGFTTNLAVRVNVDVQAYEISTDSSLLPFSNQYIEDGLILGDVFEHYALPVANGIYFNMAFTKSAIVANYNRTFTKIDDFLSYIGGLIGTMMGMFFIIGSYNKLCYQVSLGNKLFVYDKETKINSNVFNIAFYFGVLICKVGNWFGYLKDWMPIKKYEECSSEMEKQLDVGYLMKRLIFVERALLIIFDENQYTTLLLQDKPTINQIKKQREMMDISIKLQKKFDHQNKVKNNNNPSINQVWIDETGAKPIKFEPDLSESSNESLHSNSLKSIKLKIKNISQQSSQPNPNLKQNRILNLVNKSLLKRLHPEGDEVNKVTGYKNVESIQNKSGIQDGIQSQFGDISFQKIQMKQGIRQFQNEGGDY